MLISWRPHHTLKLCHHMFHPTNGSVLCVRLFVVFVVVAAATREIDVGAFFCSYGQFRLKYNLPAFQSLVHVASLGNRV